jgi:hypothetical protein
MRFANLFLISMLALSAQAKAASIVCTGKSVIATVSESQTGYVLLAKRKVYGAPQFFEGRVDSRNIIFNSSEKSLKTLEVAFAFNPAITHVAGLNLKQREFYMEDEETAKRLVTETNMDCRQQ